jgi:uncharacterized protein (DUF433 family)
MSVVLLRPDPLLGGFYTVREASRLLRIQNEKRIRSWLHGRSDGTFAPIIDRDYQPLGGSHELSFWDLIEVRFIDHFRNQGLSLQYLRKVAAAARRDLDHKHPFALSTVRFLTDRKKVFVSVAENEGEDARMREVLGNQYEMYDVIEGLLAEGIKFDPRTFVATSFQPRPASYPHVIMHPRYAYGHPVISDKRIPTSALYRMFKAESGRLDRVAMAFCIAENEVDEAVKFEVELAA